MSLTVAIISPGAMGSAIARRLTSHGATVLTSLTGRGAATRGRAEEAGMKDAGDDAITACDAILSIVPPAEAVAVARRFAPALARAVHKPVYADCNAISAATLGQIAAVIAATGAEFVDGGIIGLPAGPTIYLSGEAAPRLGDLGELGLRVRVMDAPVGAASALKLSYAGINKGLTLLAAAMILGATRAGAAEALRAELAENQPELLARLTRAIPDMLPKVWRWGPEMLEIAEFMGEDPAAREIFRGLELLCQRLAADPHGDDAAVLIGFVREMVDDGRG